MESKVFINPVSPYAYKRKNELGIVIGFVGYKPKNYESRLCYKVRFESDGVVDYVPISDVEQGLYRLISE
ncbi:hypothetical protein K4A81_10935 [Bacillus velezensis]|uniref:hypothetical protein n=1 Tax=Bacillus amyloliquefaciens group TaxID=1938374 RepID=UPI001CA441C4|nr:MULTISPECIES: hypothetical protein [Bacillus amyloliquefaciens group]MCX4184201.1 hypothetical protein [Bacillus amyloliquefaciens]QZY39759.1 hypothetical protein K4A81_10935 [Bacillus velezensis]WRT04749.1 hypothetical protein VO177_14260 [Bacillus velezensis]